MKTIRVSKTQVAKVDDADYEWLCKWKWYSCKRGTKNYPKFYAEKTTVDGRGYMHRFILGVTDRNVRVDHIDADGLNNQRSNLRLANGSQNAANRRSTPNSSSRFLGVTWCRNEKKWKAQITKDGKRIHIAYFKEEIDAAVAYNNKAKELHGEFANLNKDL